MEATFPPSTTTASTTEEMNANQNAFVNKANHTVVLVVKELLTTIGEARTMKWPEFVVTYISPKQQALVEMDERTGKFFRKMMDAINPSVMAIPTLSASFQLFRLISGDPEIDKKLIEGISLPHVKNMITELDAIKPSIVNDVITS